MIQQGRVDFKSYAIGFVVCLALTIVAYEMVVQHVFTGWMNGAAVLTLATAQAAVQLRLFLFLGKESKPKWGVLFFCFTVLTLLVVVLGSLWIMANLDYNMMEM
jgi:cytochrome o ubiquinol oxidase operon protein cyoD